MNNVNDLPTTELINRYLDGHPTEPEVASLQSRLTNDANARRTFRRLAMIAASLESVEAHPLPPDAVTTSTRTEVQKSRGRRWWPVAAAAVLLLALGIQSMDRSKSPGDLVAVVTRGGDPGGIRQDGRVSHVGDGLRLGRWQLPPGRTEVQLDSGVALALVGPGEFNLLQTDHAQLRRGQVFARVPQNAIGFRIETDSIEVVDLGTEFAVNAEADGRSAVHVYDGEVQWVNKRGTDDKSANRLLTRHQTGRWDRQGRRLAQSPLDQTKFANPVAADPVTTTDQVRWLQQPPPGLTAGRFEHDYILAFREATGVRLTESLPIVTAAPGQVGDGKTRPSIRRSRLPAGTVVDSYLIHADGLSRSMFASGTLQLPHTIVGLIIDTRQLNATDALFGHPKTTYPNDRQRGLELGLTGSIGTDGLILDRHVRQLGISMRTNASIDQIRVLTESDSAQTFAKHLFPIDNHPTPW